MYTLEKNNASPLCILCTLMPQIIPLLTLTLVHTWYEESNPWTKTTTWQKCNTPPPPNPTPCERELRANTIVMRSWSAKRVNHPSIPKPKKLTLTLVKNWRTKWSWCGHEIVIFYTKFFHGNITLSSKPCMLYSIVLKLN